MDTNSYSVLHNEYLNPWVVHLAETGTGRHLVTDALWELINRIGPRHHGTMYTMSFDCLVDRPTINSLVFIFILAVLLSLVQRSRVFVHPVCLSTWLYRVMMV